MYTYNRMYHEITCSASQHGNFNLNRSSSFSAKKTPMRSASPPGIFERDDAGLVTFWVRTVESKTVQLREQGISFRLNRCRTDELPRFIKADEAGAGSFAVVASKCENNLRKNVSMC